MKIRFQGIFAFLALLCFSSTAFALPEKHILFIGSFQADMPWERKMIQGFKQAASQANETYEVYYEHLDSSRFPKHLETDQFKNYLIEKYKNIRLDLVISSNEPASLFLENHPDLFSHIERFAATTHKAYTGKGFAIRENYKAFILNALKVSSPTKVYILGDKITHYATILLEEFSDSARELLPDARIEYLLNLSVEDFKTHTKKIEKDSIILFTPVMADLKGEKYVPYDYLGAIADLSPVPIFTHWDTLIGNGAVGGYALSGYNVGIEFFNHVRTILQGGRIEDTSINSDRYFVNLYDWQVLDRYKISPNRLPLSRVLLNENSAWERYGIYILAGLAIISGLFLLSTIWVFFLKKGIKAKTAELAQANSKLQEENEIKIKFFSVISHDLKGPLQGLLLSTNMLATMSDKLAKQDLVEISNNAHKSLQSFSELIKNLLSWSANQMSGYTIEPQIIDIEEIAHSQALLFAPDLQEFEIEIKNELQGIRVFADHEMLKTIFRNLIKNALKFTPRKGIIRITAEDEGANIKISITDSGIGIEKQKIKRLFNLNQNISTRDVHGKKGTGLGLPLCKEFVELNGGKIQVESTLNKGTTVWFTLMKPED